MKQIWKDALTLWLISIVLTLLFAAGQRSSAAQPDASRANWPSAVFDPPQPATGYAIGNQLTLRRTPNPKSPSVATIKDITANDFDHPLEVYGTSGAFLQLRHKGITGWVSLREALPHTLAFVLDAASGTTLARLPVGAGQKNIVFSPDGSRALVYGPTPTGLAVAYEYETKSFTQTRAIRAIGAHKKPVEVRAVFFGGSNSSLYAMVQDDLATYNSDFAIVRVHEKNAAAEAPVFRGSGTDFALSPDGRLGFILRASERDQEGRIREAIIDVLDLGNFSLRNTLTLTGELAMAFLGDLTTSFDGSELYLLGDVSRLRVVSTATGKELRQVPTGLEPNHELFLQNLCYGGRSLLITPGGNACEVTIPEGAWWVKGQTIVDEPKAALAFDTGKLRYGIGDGMRLVLYAADGKLVRKAVIRQPNLQETKQVSSSLSLAASPDGKRLILFVSFSEEFCPC